MAVVQLWQPQGRVVLNRRNPLTRGLVVAWSASAPLVNAADPTRKPVVTGARAVTQSGNAIRVTGTGAYIQVPVTNTLALRTNTTMAVLANLNRVNDWNPLGFLTNGGNTNSWDRGILAGNPAKWQLEFQGFYPQTTGAPALVPNVPVLLSASASSVAGSFADLYQNGIQVGHVSGSPTLSSTVDTWAVGYGDGTSANSNVALSLLWDRVLTAAEHASLAESPWQLFEAAPSFPYAALAASSAPPAQLSSAAASVAAAYGSLTTAIPLSGAAGAQATTAGALSTAIRLAGTATGLAAASGALSTAIPLTGAASASSVASGGLTTAITMAGAAAGGSTASGSLSTAIPLAGQVAAQASAAGQLSTVIALSGAAVASAAAAGALDGAGAALSGAGVAVAASSGQLSTAIQLSGAAVAGASAYGALATLIPLAGAAVAQASATGAFAGSAAALSGAALASAVASGQLATQIVLSGGAVAAAGSVGGLSTSIRLAGIAAAFSRASGDLAAGIIYARAPAGPGYSRPFTNTTRPQQVNTRRK